MHVEHLLEDESLGLRLLWAEDALLRREISGVTVTDLEDPARFVRPDEVVLSGLVWWSADEGRDKAERFVTGLKDAGAVALLAGEETHGAVPSDLVEACARHGLPVAGVPAHVLFRAITDSVYLRQWGELGRGRALPEHVRGRLNRLVAQDADPALVLAAAFAHLDAVPAYVLTATGRTVAATPGAEPLPARVAAAAVLGGDSGSATAPVEADAAAGPYGRWWLHLPDAAAAPPRLVQEITAVLGRCRTALIRRGAAERRAAHELGRLLSAAGGGDRAGDGSGEVAGAVRACGLPDEGPYRVVVAESARVADTGAAEGALAEAVAHSGAAYAVVARLPDGTAFAVLPEDAAPELARVWPLVAAADPGVPLHGGLAAPAADAAALPGALAEARYALTAARTIGAGASTLTDVTTLTTLDLLLTGVPAEVRAAYSRTVLGPLLDPANASAAALLNTLRVFLAHDGSWARTAEALHLHVNTVHYRIQRIEHFTGRDLSRLRDRLDLWAALLCHPDQDDDRSAAAVRRDGDRSATNARRDGDRSATTARRDGDRDATTARRERSSTSPARRP
ncbi:PucR family transcriptional regulator [Streptomyces sp. BBFR109]|uniref:PucR family transcriptional regulator n=1 Tax=Streptomyces sp. BBFR109 TaxID=3448172 RepID=UPI003F75845F